MEVLWLIVEEIARMQVQGAKVEYDDEYLELVESTVRRGHIG